MSWFWFEVGPREAPFECRECGDEDYIGVMSTRSDTTALCQIPECSYCQAELYEALRDGLFICPTCYVYNHLPKTATFGMILGPNGPGFYEPGAEEVKA